MLRSMLRIGDGRHCLCLLPTLSIQHNHALSSHPLHLGAQPRTSTRLPASISSNHQPASRETSASHAQNNIQDAVSGSAARSACDSPEYALLKDFKEVFDSNHDGILQEHEIRAGRELIMKYKSTKDGALSPSEISTIRQAIRAGIFGRTEWDMKLPQLNSQEQMRAFRRVVLGLTLAAILSNMDRVDMAVGIIPMSRELGWDKATAGLVQSSFFPGLLLSLLPSGLLVNSLNARKLLLAGVLIWSAATAAAPLAIDLAAATNPTYIVPAMCATRFLVGVGQGCVDASIVDTLSRWAPIEERSKSSGLAFNGYNAGMVLGLLVGPWLILTLGWRSLFYSFGSLGAVWALWWTTRVLPLPHPEKSLASNVAMAKPSPQHLQQPQQQEGQRSWRDILRDIRQLPFRSLLSHRAVQGLCVSHFIYGWGMFSLGAWLPTYISETLGLSLTNSAFLSLMPPMGGIVVGSLATAAADNFIRQGWDVTLVRRAAQGGAFVLPALCFAGAMLSQGTTSLGFIMMGQSFQGLSTAGLWCSHAEVAPKYAGLLASITCTCGSVAGTLAVAGVGALYKATGSWNVALVGPLIGMYLVGALAWSTMVVNKPQEFE